MDDKQLEELMVQSFIKIMMETEKTSDGRAELAQAHAQAEAQARAELARHDPPGMYYDDPHPYSNSDLMGAATQPRHPDQWGNQRPLDHPSGQYDGGGTRQDTHPPLGSNGHVTDIYQHSAGTGFSTAGPYHTKPDSRYPNASVGYPTTASGYPTTTSGYPTTTSGYPTTHTGHHTNNEHHIEGVYSASTHPTNYAVDTNGYTSSGYTSGNPYQFDSRIIDTTYTDNSGTVIPGYGDVTDRSGQSSFTTSTSPSRRRKFGRDHTNYALPPNLDPFKNSHPVVSHNLDPGSDVMDHAGPPGLPLSDGTNGYGEDTGLKVIVLDRTDDEDEPDVTLDGQPAYGSRSNSDVYPIDKSAIERDLYKQEYDPTVTSFKANMTPSIHSHSRRTPAGEGRTPAGVGGSGHDDVRHPNSINASQQFIYHVTDYDSDNLTQRTSSGQVIDPYKTNPQSVRSKKHSFPKRIHRAYDPVEVVEQPSTMYAMAQIDYDRYTNQSQLSTVMEDSGQETHRTDETADQYDVYTGGKSRTFLIHPSAKISTHRVPGATSPDFKVMGPGYKFQVDRYNMIKRASILNRAEKLIDARRGHYNDSQSETSDEIRQVGDDEDDEDEDDVNEMTGPRHHALRHVRQRQFDDSTSYNSSDDVLNTMRYHPRGPVSQAARRARLTSVNARLNKQKRIRQSRRQNIPPAPVSDDDVNSSQSDVMEQPPIFRKPQKIRQRYEDSRLRDVSNDVSQKQPGEGGDGIKGRRVLFFRNGDAHFKPKQVLINQKTYANLEKLLVDLSSMVETSTGVKYIFSWPEGREIKSITEFENGKYYVCSSTSKLQKVDYGNSRESHWKGGKIDRKENFLFQHDGKVQSPLRRPRVLTIISNIYRDSREKLILNTNSQMNFEDILNDISNLVNIPNPPVRALYTERAPHQKVESYSQLIREFGDHDNFLACGEELMPLELAPKKQSVNGQVEVSRKGGRKDAKSIADRQTLDSSPTRNSEMTERGGAKMNGRIKNGKPDSIKCDINGKTREFFPPSVPDEEDDGRKPEKKLKLEWVYGFRGRDMKQNLAVLPSTGQLVYSVAAVVVLYDKKFGTQKHYMGHSEDITCLTIHPNGRFIATGQTSGKTPETGAHIRVWDGTSLSTYAVIGLGTFQQGISCLNFSERGIPGTDSTTGELLMAIDDSERHQLSVWDWQTEKMVARTTTTSEPVVAGCFYLSDESILVTYGKEHIHFWKMFWDKGRKIMRDKLSGNFEGDVPKFVTSICFSPSGDVISGDSSGSILVWSRDNNNVFSINDILSRHSRKAHKKSVSALCMLGDGTLLSGGGNEVKAWDSIKNYVPVKERVLPTTAGHVRSIVPISRGGLDGSIYVSTTRNKVLEGSLQLKFKFVIQGHVEELWAVESHPLEQTFITAGHDQTVVKWSAISHASVWRVNVENPCTCISIDPKGKIVAVGTTAGKVLVLNSYNGIQLTSLAAGNTQVNALSFSPDGKQLAVGTFDGFIQIFYVQDEGHNFFRSQISSLKHNNMFIMNLDWSLDSRILQTVLGDYDIVYWDVSTSQKFKSARNFRDVKWATQNCPIGHSIIGPWQNLDRGDVINVVARSQYRDLMVVGDSKGRIRLYKWPSSVPKASFRNTKVYSTNVTCATFTYDDSFVITSGGNDAALMQFSVLDPLNTR